MILIIHRFSNRVKLVLGYFLIIKQQYNYIIINKLFGDGFIYNFNNVRLTKEYGPISSKFLATTTWFQQL